MTEPRSSHPTCPKSPTGRHDFYVLRPTVDPADSCRWCDKVKRIRRPR